MLDSVFLGPVNVLDVKAQRVVGVEALAALFALESLQVSFRRSLNPLDPKTPKT